MEWKAVSREYHDSQKISRDEFEETIFSLYFYFSAILLSFAISNIFKITDFCRAPFSRLKILVLFFTINEVFRG